MKIRIVVSLLLAGSAGVSRAQGTPSADLSLDSLLNTRISAASKYSQLSADAAASVTILSSDDLRNGGFRNLQDALESVRGFYSTDDGNYPYLGSRGFSRPSDYNNRILLLVDGHKLNEQIWGGAPVGADLPIPFEAIERIEIVRGPGSAMYGSSAMFGVINIVTRRGQDVGGTVVSAGIASGKDRQAEFTSGFSLAAGKASAMISMLASAADGRRYPVADHPEVFSAPDFERRGGLITSLLWGGASFRGGFRSSETAVVTGAYGTDPSDSRNRTIDSNLWVEAAFRTQLSSQVQFASRAYADRYRYSGFYAQGAGAAFSDEGASAAVGGEALLTIEPSSRYRLTTGLEMSRAFRVEYTELLGGDILASDKAPFSNVAVFAENELQLKRGIKLVAGGRVEVRQRFEPSLAPRLAVVAQPREATTVKLLYGRAFRAPSSAEAEIDTDFYSSNATLTPEWIETFELEVRERIRKNAIVEASVYHYHMSGLINPVDTDGGSSIRFENMDNAGAMGAEVQVDVGLNGPLSARAGYAFQRDDHLRTGERLANAPAHIATAEVVASGRRGLRSSLRVRSESGRLTHVGTMTRAFTRMDFHFALSPMSGGPASGSRGPRLSLGINNLLAAHYSLPAGIEHPQPSLVQSGRVASFRIEWRF